MGSLKWLGPAQLAVLGMMGGGFFISKGVIRATSGEDLSFVPVSLFLIGFGLLALASTVRATHCFGMRVLVGRGLGVVTTACGLVALMYVLTGTIPETDGAPATVGIAYGLGAGAAFSAQLLLGVSAARSRALPGRLRWAPLGVVALQFPVFIVAGAIGDGIGDDTVTDGLGMALTGLLWVGSSAAVFWAVAQDNPQPTLTAA